jgi:hypothetical protein
VAAGDPGDAAFDIGRCRREVAWKPGSAARVRCARSSASCGCRLRLRPSRAVVQRARSQQPRQAVPKLTHRWAVIGRMTPAGQVAVPAAPSMGKSSRVIPPGDRRAQRPGFDHRGAPGRGEGLAGAVGRIAERFDRPATVGSSASSPIPTVASLASAPQTRVEPSWI